MRGLLIYVVSVKVTKIYLYVYSIYDFGTKKFNRVKDVTF